MKRTRKMPSMARTGPRAAKTYALTAETVMCLHCGEGTANHPDGRPRLYCSDRCRVAAHRAKTKRAG